MADPDQLHGLANQLRNLGHVSSGSELNDRFERFLAGVQVPQLLQNWFDLVVPILTETLRESLETGEGPVNVGEDPLAARISAWNLLGSLAILAGQPRFATDLFTTLLRELRAVQPKRGRVHKGTPYHQIGWSLLVAHDAEHARDYFLFATIEDLITDGGDATHLNSPASRTLQMQYGETREFLQALAARIRPLMSDQSPEAQLKLQNPELLAIDPVRVATVSSRGSAALSSTVNLRASSGRWRRRRPTQT
jgi:hypothetical protein